MGQRINIANDNLVNLVHLQDESTGLYVNDANVQLQLLDGYGYIIFGPVTMNYVTQSNGQYQGAVNSYVQLIPNSCYRLQVTATSSGGLIGFWNVPVEAVFRE